MSSAPRRPGPESTLDDVKSQLIAAALDRLATSGIDFRLTEVTLSDAIADAGVTRSTAYRSLAHESLAPQDVLRHETLRHVLGRDAREANLGAVSTAVLEELEAQADNMASADVADRTTAFRALIRVGAEMSYLSVAASTERAILTAAYGALRSSNATDWRMKSLALGEDNITHLFAELYTSMASMFGFRLKPAFDIVQFCTAAAALVEGLAMRHGLNNHLQDIMRPTGDAGALEAWSLYGLSFEGLFMAFFEPVNPDDPMVDLQLS